jgi:hypothetical protein
MAYNSLISNEDEIILDNVWDDITCLQFMNKNSDLATILINTLVKIADQKDLYENLLKLMSESKGNKECLQVDLYNYNTVWYKGDERNYATVAQCEQLLQSGQSGQSGKYSLFEKTIGDIGYQYETKVSQLADLFCKMPRDLVMNNGKEYSLQEIITRLVILPVVSAYIGDKCWVSVKNVGTTEYGDFYVAACCISVRYMPEGLTEIMKRTRAQAVNQYEKSKNCSDMPSLIHIDDYSDMPPLIPINNEYCSKVAYYEY